MTVPFNVACISKNNLIYENYLVRADWNIYVLITKIYLTSLFATINYRKLNFRQQIEMLKREIVDQEREYKNQISALETKAHEQWVRLTYMNIYIYICY